MTAHAHASAPGESEAPISVLNPASRVTVCPQVRLVTLRRQAREAREEALLLAEMGVWDPNRPPPFPGEQGK